VATERPGNFVNRGISEGAVVSNSRNLLKWNASDPEGGELTYRLYVGETPDKMNLMYEGKNNCSELKSLNSAKDITGR